MIKAVLLDLDDTLIETNTNEFFPAYIAALGSYGSDIASAETFSQAILQTYSEVLSAPDPTGRLYDRFMDRFAHRFGRDLGELAAIFRAFYRDCYPAFKSLVHPRPQTERLLTYLFKNQYEVVIATNPALPEIAIAARMEWGGISSPAKPFTFITTLENMHFGKPQPEYYEEIMLRLALDPGEALMVGDDWDQDIVPAAEAGLCTFWLSNNGHTPPSDLVPISGMGSYDVFVDRLEAGWLDTLVPPRATSMPDTLIHRLRAFPAAVDTLRRAYSREILECSPGNKEWSARHIICHLRDHEAEEDRTRLERILAFDNPFISANYDPWAYAQRFSSVTADQALIEFADLRMKTVDWLRTLPREVWSRPARFAIFGPTTFEEMVRFTSEHDLTHLRQMIEAINRAVVTCGP